jgi:hypothetical protein
MRAVRLANTLCLDSRFPAIAGGTYNLVVLRVRETVGTHLPDLLPILVVLSIVDIDEETFILHLGETSLWLLGDLNASMRLFRHDLGLGGISPRVWRSAALSKLLWMTSRLLDHRDHVLTVGVVTCSNNAPTRCCFSPKEGDFQKLS